jgi:signal peptidase II
MGMTKKDWFVIYSTMLFVLVSDHLLKRWAMDLQGFHWYGNIGFVLTLNPGAMLGLFADMPPLLRVVALSTGGGFLLVSFAIVQYLLPIRSLLLRTGLGVLLAGILGNVIDRTVWGHVVDFIVVRAFERMSPVFNPADAFQWFGYACVVVALIRDGELLWPENDVRGKYWINPRFQLRYCLKLVGVGVGFSIIAGIFFYSYLRVTLTELMSTAPQEELFHRFLLPFVATYAIVTLAFGIILFWFGKLVSHRIAGPVYALQRFLKDNIEGRPARLKLRVGDEFPELEEFAKQWDARMHGGHQLTNVDVVSLGDHIADTPSSTTPSNRPRKVA